VHAVTAVTAFASCVVTGVAGHTHADTRSPTGAYRCLLAPPSPTSNTSHVSTRRGRGVSAAAAAMAAATMAAAAAAAVAAAAAAQDEDEIREELGVESLGEPRRLLLFLGDLRDMHRRARDAPAPAPARSVPSP
jgi:hypothetical protein